MTVQSQELYELYQRHWNQRAERTILVISPGPPKSYGRAMRKLVDFASSW